MRIILHESNSFSLSTIRKLEGINVLKRGINDKNSLQSKILKLNDNKKEHSFDLDEEEDDYYDDDFEVNEKIFYFTGYFYDDFDIIAFKDKKKNQNLDNLSSESEITYKKENTFKNGASEINNL